METLALYMRISSEDSNADIESGSIGNQRDLLYNFLSNRREFDGWNVLEFCDDGYSGTSFDRPGIQKLLLLAGNTVKCIIVKDFSRFGRNLIEVGDYLDQIFPFLGVRFIAVNEGYDSMQSLGSSVSLDVSLKALVYEMYSRDISEKIRCVKQAKLRRGEYLGNIAFYGYRLSPAEKNKLVIDEPAAKVVRRIFNRAAEGISMTDIAVELNRDGVLSPFMYRRENNLEVRCAWRVGNDKNCWTRENVKRIISDERYTGCLISNTRVRVDVTTKRTQPVPKEDWIVVENTQEAIVSKEVFEQAQAVMRQCRNRKKTRKSAHMFHGLVKCVHCGRTLARGVCRQRPYYYCVTRRTMPDSPCADVRLEEQDLEKALLSAIHTQVQLMLHPVGTDREILTADGLQEAIRECQTLISRNKAAQTAAFEDYAEGRISKQEYLYRKKETARQQEEATAQYAELTDQMAELQSETCTTSDLGRYAFVEKLTREMLEALVREIRVSGKDSMEIVWNFME